MCKLCAIAVRSPRIRQESLVFNLSQFAVAIEAKQQSKQHSEQQFEQPQTRSLTNTQEKSS